jgi:hypothetical protein
MSMETLEYVLSLDIQICDISDCSVPQTFNNADARIATKDDQVKIRYKMRPAHAHGSRKYCEKSILYYKNYHKINDFFINHDNCV